MIKCREDLLNTCIFNGSLELKKAYLSKCEEFGINWSDGKGPFSGMNLNSFGIIKYSDGGLYLTSDILITNHYKEINIEDLLEEDEMEIALIHIQDLLSILSHFPRDDFDGYTLNTIKEAEDFSAR